MANNALKKIEAMKACCPGLKLVNTHTSPGIIPGFSEPDNLKPDISVYNRSDPRTKTRNRLTDFSVMDIHIEFKLSNIDNPFSDKLYSLFEKATKADQDTRGQITTYSMWWHNLALSFGLIYFLFLFFAIMQGLYAGIGQGPSSLMRSLMRPVIS
jgi:hypothetical protein